MVTNDVTQAVQIFPGSRLIPVQLESADVLPGPAVAWESLDAIVLSAELFGRVTDAQRSVLLAGGVTLAAIGQNVPDTSWPWKRQGSLWILRCTPAGPDQLVNADAFSPTFFWKPGLSIAVRWQVMGAATVLLFITTALMLRQNRFVPVIAIALMMIAGLGFACWKKALPDIDRIGGDVIVNHGGLVQRDQWVFQRAKQWSFPNVPWSGSTHPVFPSTNAMTLQLNVAASGDLAFVYQAVPQHTMAFVRRGIERFGISSAIPTRDSPMEELAKAVYLETGDRIAGETPGTSGRWPSVVIDRN